ncbi:helix-turn-helix domain-containing protein [Thomasclavelia cocleata]|uniref:helix-turn-helix domain-containing protein n=1 Tax=Thomasclavelia cocleata TaxID=69824 RepID=UPI00257109A8|nr:helix-turn-helix transcriptional regulator [Thomasclavelia cocleata]
MANTTEIKKTFAKNLKYYMKCNGLNQTDISKIAHVSKQSVSYWLNGKLLPRMGAVEYLAEYFGIMKSDLLEENNNVNNIWKNIKQIRENKGITKNKLSLLSNIPLEVIDDIENNEKIPDYNTLVKLSKILNCEISYLLLGEKPGRYDMSIIDQIDEIMSGDNEARKKLIKSAIDLSDEDILFMEKVLNALNEKKAN